jgi:predicted alpha/beta-hydrolase family hydrolase
VRITAQHRAGLERLLRDRARPPFALERPRCVMKSRSSISKLLSTGVDAKICKLIVLDPTINSLTQFKQMTGWGTRIRDDAQPEQIDGEEDRAGQEIALCEKRVCMMDPLLTDGPTDARCHLILAHGAGQGADSPFMSTVARALATAGLRVTRFSFPYIVRSEVEGRRRPPDREPILIETWLRVIAEQRAAHGPVTRLLIGGKSMGGRIASLIADEAGVDGLVCLGYPFHPPGRPERTRVAHLSGLGTSALICQGERDPFGSREEVAGYVLSPSIEIVWIADGEHSYKPRRASGVTLEQNLSLAANAVVSFAARLA